MTSFSVTCFWFFFNVGNFTAKSFAKPCQSSFIYVFFVEKIHKLIDFINQKFFIKNCFLPNRVFLVSSVKFTRKCQRLIFPFKLEATMTDNWHQGTIISVRVSKNLIIHLLNFLNKKESYSKCLGQ